MKNEKGIPFVSIVIPIFNGDAFLHEVLRMVCRQKTSICYEIICIDSGSTDTSKSVCQQYHVRYYEIPQKQFNHGLTRNQGVHVSKGELIVFLSQDAIPAGDYWLENLIAPFKDKQVAGVYGRQIPRDDADVLTKKHLNSWLTGEKETRISFIQNKEEYMKLPSMKKYELCNFDNVCSCIRKSVWTTIPFEKTVFAEDLTWSKKALGLGYKIVYEPKAAVIHSHQRSVLYEYKRTYVCHRKLYELFKIQTVPTLKDVMKCFFMTMKSDLPYVYYSEKDIKKKTLSILRVPVLSFLCVYAQYKGARDERNNYPLRKTKGV